MKLRKVFLVLTCLAICISLVSGNAKAADSDKLVVLKAIEGTWNSSHQNAAGVTANKKVEFKLEGTIFITKVTRKGLPPEETRIELGEIEVEGQSLALAINYPPFVKKARIKVDPGAF